MSEWLNTAGADALVLFWWPVALWTVSAAVIVGLLRFVPERYAREQYELRTALLVALPVGLGLAVVFRAVAADALFTVTLPYEIVVRADGPTSAEIVDLSTVAGVSVGSLLLALGAAAVALFGLASLVADVRSLGRFRSGLRDVDDPAVLDLLEQAKAGHGVSRPVRLVSTDAIGTPAAFGWLRPTVVVPDSLLRTPDEMRLVLLHETAHLARGDFALDTLARVVRTLFGWHPLVAHVFRTQAFWREAACDLAVLTAPQVDRSAYARLLLSVSTATRRPQPALVASMTASPSQLTKRIEAMTRITNPNLTLPSVRHALVALLMTGVVTFTACSDSTPAAVDTAEDAQSVEARTVDGEDVFVVVEQMPELIGGLHAVGNAIQYPPAAKEEGVEGRVIVQFVVEKNGDVSNATVVRGVDSRLDDEALRAVKSIRFEPGMQRGEAVRVKMSLPVTFKLK